MDLVGEIVQGAWPHSQGVLLLALAVSFGAGFVRGFSGFGYSALVVAALSPFVMVGPLVAAVLMLEVAASARVVRQVMPEVHRSWHAFVLGGNLLFVPLGLAAIAWLEPKTVRILLNMLVLSGAATLRFAWGRRLAPTRLLCCLTGAASGLLNGFAASGGIIAALMMVTTGTPPAALRATMISVLLWISLYALGCSAILALSGSKSLLGIEALGWALILWPSMAVGIQMGARLFSKTDQRRQGLTVLNILMAVATAALIAALQG